MIMVVLLFVMQETRPINTVVFLTRKPQGCIMIASRVCGFATHAVYMLLLMQAKGRLKGRLKVSV